jgi:hypothetical protein
MTLIAVSQGRTPVSDKERQELNSPYTRSASR